MPLKKKTPEIKKWSKQVTEKSNALDLEAGVFKLGPKKMALSLKQSAENSQRRKASPFRSAMSMLTFYQNRAGKNLSTSQKEVLQKAKNELRKLYDRPVDKKTTKF
jgi:hypothetical protein